jgi:cytochrome P450
MTISRTRSTNDGDAATPHLRFISAETDGYPTSDEEILDVCFPFIMAGLDTAAACSGARWRTAAP